MADFQTLIPCKVVNHLELDDEPRLFKILPRRAYLFPLIKNLQIDVLKF
jgi:hypothetical protein